MKYLVLGSEGQIGYALKDFLLDKGHEVLEYDIVRSKYEDLRLTNNTLLEKKIYDCDFVFFLAFDVGGSRYLKKYQNTFDFLHNNISLMKETFALLKKHNKKFIFASSQMSNMDYSPYGLCKSIGERYTECLNGIVVKFWNVYGYERDLEKAHVITDFILKSLQNKKISMLTNGSEQRQFLNATDCSNALYILSKKYNQLPREKQYHITSFEWINIKKIADIISNLTGDTPVIPSNEVDTLQKNRRNQPDPHILKYWTPKITIESGIKQIIQKILQENKL
tara:strand:+ start:6875 stop:7714 length:840 start_codon:yes stop_codon:yes gene_type:complete